MIRAFIFSAALSMTFVSAVPSYADDNTDPNDPTRMICKRIEVMGSRLKAKKVCMSAGEWEAQRASDRQDVEKNQALRTKNNDH